MNAQTQSPADQSQSSQPDENEIGKAFVARASGLSKLDADGAAALAEDAVIAELSEAFFTPIANAIHKSTGLSRKFYFDMMCKRRVATTASSTQRGNIQPAIGSRNPDPAPNPEPLAKSLEQIVRVIQRQVVCNGYTATTVALWIVATYGLRGASIFPRLAVTSATKRCGKSTLLAAICVLASNPVKTDNVTASAIFRLLSLDLFTLIIDEVDAFFRSSDDLRGVVNASHERTGSVLRSVPTPDGKSYTVAEFKVFCAMVLAGIGGLPDTVLDRSIIIKLERAVSRAIGGRQPSMRHRELAKVRAIIVPHLVAHAPAIEAALEAGVKLLPPGLSDRAQDGWEPLLAVADLAGGHWPKFARDAAQMISGGNDAPSQREMLLADLRQIVTDARQTAVTEYREWVRSGRNGARPTPVQRIRSADFLPELVKLEHRPWPEYGKDSRGLSLHRLAALLKPFGIEPTKQRVPARHPVGLRPAPTESVRVYSVPTLRRAFRQYLA